MARPKKKIENNDVLLSQEEVWNVLEFSQALVSGLYHGVYTPDLMNARMKEISYSPLSPTETNLNNALASPKDSEELLRSYIEYFEIVSMPFKRILSYLSSHLSFDLTYTVKNADPKDYVSPKFKKDQSLVYEFFDKFDYKYFFRNALKQMLRNEIYVATIREDKDRIVLQELPLRYCKITARGSYGLLVSFDFSYFLQAGIDIDLYDPFFKRKYNEVFKNTNSTRKEYNPGLSPEMRGNSQFAYWVDLPPDVAWGFKLDTSQIVATPLFTGMLKYLIHDATMLSLQKDTNMASASKILLGQVPMLKDSKAQVKDMIAIDPKTLGQFLSLVKASMASAIKIAAVPLEDTKVVSFENDKNELLDTWTRTEMNSSGMDTALIYSGQLKANLVDSQLSFESDSKIVEQSIYPQMNAFLDYWVNKRTSKFKYSHRLEGNDYYLSRTQRFDRSTQLLDKGIVLPQMIAASMGLKPQELYRMLEESKALNITTELLTPIVSAFQQSGDGEKGRPSKSDSELGESGSQTKGAGGNIERGGKQ